MIQKQWGWHVLSFVVILIFAGSLSCLHPCVRRYLYMQAHVHKSKLMDNVWKHLDKVLMLSYLWLLSLPLLITWQWIGSGLPRLEALAVGFILVAFVALELPRLLKPNAVILMMQATGRGYKANGSSVITLKGGQPNLIYFCLANAGTNFYGNCQCWFLFEEGFMPLTDEGLYDGIDFRKDFIVQQQNRAAVFLPHSTYLGVAPTNHIVFPVWVRTPAEKGLYPVRVLVASESTWGEFSTELRVEVT